MAFRLSKGLLKIPLTIMLLTLTLLSLCVEVQQAQAQNETQNEIPASTQSESAPQSIAAPPSSLELSPEKVSHLQSDIAARNYTAAQRLLIDEIEQSPHTLRAARLLAYLGSVYFLNQDPLNAAVAWKKSNALTPLDASLQFSLAMAYIQIARPDWASTELQKLSNRDPQNALYLYWIGRISYDSQHYADAVRSFQKAIALDPGFARAYDNLGLCFFSQNDNQKAVQAFRKAIELDQSPPSKAQHPSPWPYLNLAITLDTMGKSEEAEHSLRHAIQIDPHLAQAHYQLGNVLEEEHPQEAMSEFLEASRLDEKYAEPHIALAHLYHASGQEAAAKKEVEKYLKLHQQSTSQNSPAQSPQMLQPHP